MWTSNFLFETLSWTGGNPGRMMEALELSDTPREFIVRLFIDDVRLLRREIQILAKNDQSVLTIRDKNGDTIKAKAIPNQEGKIESIVCQVFDTTPMQALWQAFNRISSLLSYWSFVNGGSSRVYAVSIRDCINEIELQSFPDTGIGQNVAVDIFLPPKVSQREIHNKLLSLYRESRNSSSPYYSFLCSYKIMEAVANKGLLKETDTAIRELGINDTRKWGRITEGLLGCARAKQKLGHYQEMGFQEFMCKIADVRAKVAHAISDGGEIINFDNFDEFNDISYLASVCDLIAREILEEEFRLLDVMRSLTDESDAPFVPFVDESNFVFLRSTVNEKYGLKELLLERRD